MAAKRILVVNPETVRGQMQLLGDDRKRLEIDGTRIPCGHIIEVYTPTCVYELTRIDEVEWVILGSARFREPTLCFPHDGIIEQGRALLIGTKSGEEFPTAVVTDIQHKNKAAKRASKLIEQAQAKQREETPAD